MSLGAAIKTSCLVLVGLMAALAPSAHAEKPQRRANQVTVPALDAWRSDGFRLSIGFGIESFREMGLAPGMNAWQLAVEPAYRFSEMWEIGANLRYSPILGGDWSGLRWGGVLEGRFFPWGRAWIGLGAGYGGAILAHRYIDSIATPTGVLQSCRGFGFLSSLRLGYRMAAGELFATGPVVSGELHGLRCTGDSWHYEEIPIEPSGRENAGSSYIEAERVELSEMWWQMGFTVGWFFSWR